jgi:hypothetical protein
MKEMYTKEGNAINNKNISSNNKNKVIIIK